VTRTFTATRALRSLTALLTAHVVSQTGNVVTLFAVPFYVLSTGGTGIEVGTAAFFATVPVIIGGPLAVSSSTGSATGARASSPT